MAYRLDRLDHPSRPCLAHLHRLHFPFPYYVDFHLRRDNASSTVPTRQSVERDTHRVCSDRSILPTSAGALQIAVGHGLTPWSLKEFVGHVFELGDP